MSGPRLATVTGAKALTDTNMGWGSVTGTWMALDREERLWRLAKSVFFFLGGGKGFFFFKSRGNHVASH